MSRLGPKQATLGATGKSTAGYGRAPPTPGRALLSLQPRSELPRPCWHPHPLPTTHHPLSSRSSFTVRPWARGSSTTSTSGGAGAAGGGVVAALAPAGGRAEPRGEPGAEPPASAPCPCPCPVPATRPCAHTGQLVPLRVGERCAEPSRTYKVRGGHGKGGGGRALLWAGGVRHGLNRTHYGTHTHLAAGDEDRTGVPVGPGVAPEQQQQLSL